LFEFSERADIVRYANLWNDLWQRSNVQAPSARAELVASWLEHFAPREPVRILVVADQKRWLAVLPLVGRKVKRVLRVAMLAANEWTSGGDLLVDPAANVELVLDELCAGIARLPWPLLWFNEVPLAEPQWQAFRAALARANMMCDTTTQHQVAQVEISHDWKSYEASRDGDHRRSRRRYARKLAEAGTPSFSLESHTDPAELNALVQQTFEVEDRSWKGAAGTSVIRSGYLPAFQHQAKLLRAFGALEIATLKLDDAPIAFAYCMKAKGVRFIAKLGYDENFRQFGPGQQLVMHLLEAAHADPECRMLDFWGPLAPWNDRWGTATYEVGRLVAAPPKMLSRGAFYAYEALRDRKKAAAATAVVETPAQTPA
jgi:CelD/BcsL family acetyltransferase involved in cellulose biosynthesis